MTAPNPRVTCDTCGTHTGVDSHVCGRCATDWNDMDVEAGRRRINARRKVNGLPPLAEASQREVKRRTFEAAKHPKGSPERQALNEAVLTSEYMTSYRYCLVGADGRGTSYRTKAEAEAARS